VRFSRREPCVDPEICSLSPINTAVVVNPKLNVGDPVHKGADATGVVLAVKPPPIFVTRNTGEEPPVVTFAVADEVPPVIVTTALTGQLPPVSLTELIPPNVACPETLITVPPLPPFVPPLALPIPLIVERRGTVKGPFSSSTPVPRCSRTGISVPSKVQGEAPNVFVDEFWRL